MRRWVACGIAALGVLAAAPAHAQAKSEIAVTRQPGILYLASHVMEEHKLIEASIPVPAISCSCGTAPAAA
jgi:NitT/TauT family transport system substrate-binding protein